MTATNQIGLHQTSPRLGRFDAGFSRVAITEKTHPTVFVPINSFAYGSATK